MRPTGLRHTPAFPHSRLCSALALAIGMLGFCGAQRCASAQTIEESSAATPAALKQALQDQRADYRDYQFGRLARNTDRDSSIAAVLIGMPGVDREALAGETEAIERLARTHSDDPVALFALTLACQMQREPCAHAEAYDALLRVEPGNAVDLLMLANGAAPNGAQLHAAATATGADTHWRDIVRITRGALAGQAPSSAPAGVDHKELALLLRRDAVDQVPLPKFGATTVLCKGAVEQLRADCLELGRKLENDASGTFLSRMVGSAIVRRLVKGTPEEVAAKELRRDYTWLSEQLVASKMPFAERLQEEGTTYGEWEAWGRAVERLGETRLPPPNWLPEDPQTLLLSEERTQAQPK